MKVVRIANSSGYWGDDPEGPEGRWQDWHRRQHEGGESSPPPSTPDEA